MSEEKKEDHGTEKKKPSGPPWGMLVFIVVAGFLIPTILPMIATALANFVAVIMTVFRQYFGAFLMGAVLWAAFKWVRTWAGAAKANKQEEHH